MVIKKLPFPLVKPAPQIDQAVLKRALSYIENYWQQLARTHKEEEGTIVGLPYPYIVAAADPKAAFRLEEQYYWDTYFTTLGLTSPKKQVLVEGMLENLLFLYRRFGMIPNASRMYFTSRSQPPVLTSLIMHIYETYHKDLKWLEKKMAVAQEEYERVWMNDQHPQWHRVHRDLSRYYDINMLHDLAEAESGWDMTPRFERKCLDFLPVDLNSLLYKYETDFAQTASLLGDEKNAITWQKKANKRKDAVNELMWGKLRGFYFDYNYQRKALGDIWSLASFYPLWVGLATDEQARKVVDNLTKFERKGGLTTTSRPIIDTYALFGSIKAQWAYPNGWAPLHFIVCEGLKRYGYHEHAQRIASKWVKTNLDWFDVHGIFLEKYNVVNPNKPPVEGMYPSQTGFGWTNALLVKFVNDFNLLK